MTPGNSSSLPPVPHLERYPEQGGPAERVALTPLPLTVGRTEDADHTIYSGAVSKRHAVFVRIGERYAVRDLQSTNGTFVNGQRVVEQVLEDGDIIHFAHVEFCFHHLVGKGIFEASREIIPVNRVTDPFERFFGGW